MKTCFVIAPIGSEGSETRKNSDDLYELIIEPALDKLGFKDVIRGDMESSSGSITDDIIKRIQNSELCIIDITGHNPNVFYECGRRHETAKPFILMKRKGEVIPFDLFDIRAVDYDLSDPRKTKNSIDNLRKFVSEFEENGYGSESPTASLTSIANALLRIERKLDTYSSSKPEVAAPTDYSISGSPAAVFYNAMDASDYSTAVKALKKFLQISPDINRNLDMATMVVEAYEPTGVPIVRALLEKDFDRLESSKIAIALHGLYTFYVGAISIDNEGDYLRGMVKKTLERTNLSDNERASLYNTLASIEYSTKNDIQALKYQERTVEFAPSEPAYQYNISRIYEALGMNDKLLTSLSFLISIYKNRDTNTEAVNFNYLDFAKKIFRQNNQLNKVDEIDEIILNANKENIGNNLHVIKNT